MAILLNIKVTGNQELSTFFPPGLQTYVQTVLLPGLASKPHMADTTSGSSVVFFSDESEMDAFLTSIKLTSEQQAQFDEWKTARGIVVTYTAYGLTPAADVTITPAF